MPLDSDNVAEGIQRALALDERPVFLEGLSERLNELGVKCNDDEIDIMLAEVKRRYKKILGKSCPKAVQNWVRGTTPGTANRMNNYNLCCALEMDYRQTADFFRRHFLTIPFNCKSKLDAVYLYCFYRNKPYSAVTKLLERASRFVPQENAHTATSQIFSAILDTDNDEQFLQYLSRHCYDNEQQFQLARNIINKEIEQVKTYINKDTSVEKVSPARLNSLTISFLLGYKYQEREPNHNSIKLPKRFTESLPNDVTLGRMINGRSISYEALRKTLMLLKFHNFYYEAQNADNNLIKQNLLDFCDELNVTLSSCGFSPIYILHPFDCLLLYCANSYDPIVTLHSIMES